MLNRLPKHTRTFQELALELGLNGCSDVELARALGVSPRTIGRWKSGNAPRVALLALWWLSEEGHSTWDSEMHNRTLIAIGLARAQADEIKRLRSLAASLGRLGDFGAMNDPAPNVLAARVTVTPEPPVKESASRAA